MDSSVERIGNVVLDYTHYCGEDLYSDGAIEDVLLDIVKNNDSSEYGRIIEEKNDWAILYHLSELRGNIVEWLPIEKEANVLEVGSGCGAITGTLADKCKEVTCIELSKKRSLINAYRNSKRDNINILVGNFRDVEKDLTKKYDYITLIGVLEYAESYMGTEDAYVDFLKIISKHLKEDGCIVVAIENRLGLKYWAGCREDHVGRFYEGIEDYTETSGVKTFSKKAITDIARRAGLNRCIFYYPYPDYKLPTTMFSDAFLPRRGELKNNNRNFDASRISTFDESKVFDTLIDEKMFPTFANSFLVLMGKDE